MKHGLMARVVFRVLRMRSRTGRCFCFLIPSRLMSAGSPTSLVSGLRVLTDRMMSPVAAGMSCRSNSRNCSTSATRSGERSGCRSASDARTASAHDRRTALSITGTTCSRGTRWSTQNRKTSFRWCLRRSALARWYDTHSSWPSVSARSSASSPAAVPAMLNSPASSL